MTAVASFVVGLNILGGVLYREIIVLHKCRYTVDSAHLYSDITRQFLFALAAESAVCGLQLWIEDK